MTYQRKKFNEEVYDVIVRDSVDGTLPVKSFKYYKAATRYIAQQTNPSEFAIKTTRATQAIAAE